jgi:hypothetical protein
MKHSTLSPNRGPQGRLIFIAIKRRVILAIRDFFQEFLYKAKTTYTHSPSRHHTSPSMLAQGWSAVSFEYHIFYE